MFHESALDEVSGADFSICRANFSICRTHTTNMRKSADPSGVIKACEVSWSSTPPSPSLPVGDLRPGGRGRRVGSMTNFRTRRRRNMWIGNQKRYAAVCKSAQNGKWPRNGVRRSQSSCFFLKTQSATSPMDLDRSRGDPGRPKNPESLVPGGVGGLAGGRLNEYITK